VPAGNPLACEKTIVFITADSVAGAAPAPSRSNSQTIFSPGCVIFFIGS
jgi:hypothetical protein